MSALGTAAPIHGESRSPIRWVLATRAEQIDRPMPHLRLKVLPVRHPELRPKTVVAIPPGWPLRSPPGR